ncbi:MAG TPA: GFA family protein [Rhizomicrobium sp.]|nr:GFA family protein [Rhizomicrobium sp.]
MSDKHLQGGCQCGNVRYRIAGEPAGLVVCHCNDCKKQSSSAFGMSLFVLTRNFAFITGQPKSFTVTADSGRLKTCTFCPDCGSRLTHQTRPQALSVKAGTLDDATGLTPSAHYWTKRKLPWVIVPSGVKCVEDDG